MSVRFFLAAFVHAGAAVLDERDRFVGQFALGIDGIDDHIATGVIGDENVVAEAIDDDMAGMRALGGDFVYFC